MPKQLYELRVFDGGLRNVTAPRDLEDTELHKLNSAVVSKTGTIRLMGQEVPHAITQENDIETSITAYFGLDVFRSDFPYIKGCFNGKQIGSPKYHVDAYGDNNFVERSFDCNIISAGTSSPGGAATLRVECNLKHGITDGMIINLKGTVSSTYDTGANGAKVFKVDDKNFDIVSTVSYSNRQPVNWITDPETDITELEADDVLLNPKPGSFRFVILQNKNLFHLYQHTIGKFFNSVGAVSGIENSMVQPHYKYIDEAVRCVDSNFNNKNIYSGTFQRGYSPRWFGFIPRRTQFKTLNSADSPSRIITPAWKNELNNVYDADCIAGYTVYPTEDYLFRVAAGDEDDDDYSATDESAYDITSDSKHPMKVWMSVSVDSSGGNWMMSEGGDHEKLKFGIAYIYDDYPYEQESRLFKSDTQITMSTKTDYASMSFELKCMDRKWPVRVIGFSIYLWYINGEIKDPRWMGSCKFDYREGWEGQDGIRVGWEGDYSGGTTIASRVVIKSADKMKSVPSISYKFRNGYEHDLDSATFRYKTSAVVNGKLYAGNVMQVGGSNHNLVSQDKMLVSPVRKYDILDPTSELTVTTSDGDEIIALIGFGNKLLQFKKQKLYIIFTGDASGEQVEATHDYMGIRNIDAVTKFNGGVAWLNVHGVYLYDGQEIFNVLANKIDPYFWRACLGPSKKASIGYMSDKKELIIYFENTPYDSPRIDSLYMDQDGNADTGGSLSRNANVMIYNFETDSWAFGSGLATDEIRTNMVDDFEDKLMFGIGEGIVNENHSVANVVDATTPNYSEGRFSFRSTGFWDDTYSHLHFYDKDGTPRYIGNCSIGRDVNFDYYNDQGQAGENTARAEAYVLATKIATVIREDDTVDYTDDTIDEDGNATTQSYFASLTTVVLPDQGIDDDDPF